MTGNNISSISTTGPIGIFDSGVGGLSVWREIRRQLPQEATLYFADQAHVPYGPRKREEILGFSEAITDYLLTQSCKAIVVACNTASAAALKQLRERFPHKIIIGMEPAVKPAAASTRSGVIGIMATAATFQGRLFLATAGRHAHDRQLVNQICHGLAEHIEAGHLDDKATEVMLRGFIQPMLEADADTIVLACTHYPFVLPMIQRLAGNHVNVIDPAPAIARHLKHCLSEAHLLNNDNQATREISSQHPHRLLTSGDQNDFTRIATQLLGSLDAQMGSLSWQANDRLASSQEPS